MSRPQTLWLPALCDEGAPCRKGLAEANQKRQVATAATPAAASWRRRQASRRAAPAAAAQPCSRRTPHPVVQQTSVHTDITMWVHMQMGQSWKAARKACSIHISCWKQSMNARPASAGCPEQAAQAAGPSAGAWSRRSQAAAPPLPPPRPPLPQRRPPSCPGCCRRPAASPTLRIIAETTTVRTPISGRRELVWQVDAAMPCVHTLKPSLRKAKCVPSRFCK
jgi:hypothetical protein